MTMLSAGVYINEIDNSAIVPTVSNSVAFFAGNFTKGPIEQPFVVTNKNEYRTYFGDPTDTNYNEWFQGYKFFDYGNQLVISRSYTEEKPTISTVSVANNTSYEIGLTELSNFDSVDGIYVGDSISFGSDVNKYVVTGITFDDIVEKYTISIEGGIIDVVTEGTAVMIYASHQNAGADAVQDPSISNPAGYEQTFELFKNPQDFDYKKDNISFDTNVKLKFAARTAGSVNNDIEIAICNPVDFTDYVNDTNGMITYSDTRAEAFDGVPLSNFFDYTPTGEDEVGIIIRQGNEVESFIVSFDETSVDGNNKSKYVENVINDNSNLVYVVDNKTLGKISKSFEPYPGEDVINYNTYIVSRLAANSQGSTAIEDGVYGSLTFFGGESPEVTIGDIRNAYDEVLDKEVYEIDIVIGNEKDEGAAAVNLANTREDCIAMIGARYEDVVGKRAADAVANVISYIKSNAVERTMFAAFFANYHRIYDNFNKKYRWINVAGDMAGLRADTNTNRAAWWASAGLRRGGIRNIDKVAFSPSEPQRGQLYKNNINPIVSFPGDGNLCYGQKTLINYASSFDRVNVRGLFNTIERAMAKAARSQLFEFNDVFTRNSILSMFNPYLSSVKAGRGIDEFLVVCDETNNTADAISRNELIVDIYIKPAYAAEFIQLTFNNVGTRSFSSVIGA